MSPATALPSSGHGASRVTRRALLAASLVLAAGCSPDDPTVQAPPALGQASAGATPTPDPALVQAAAREAAMSGWLTGALKAAPEGLPAATATVLRSLAAAHQTHATTLARLSGGQPPAAPATTVRGAWAAVLPQLAAKEHAVQAAHRAAATGATDGSTCLLFASLATFAGAAATPTLAPLAGRTQPATVDVGTRLQALQVLLGQLRALAQGLEIGAGQLPMPSDLYSPARERLTQVWALRDETEQAVIKAKGTPDPSLASYRMPGAFGSTAAIQATWGALELAVLNAWGRVAAASQGADRSQALDQMAAQAGVVTGNRTALPVWPGWA